MCVAVPLEVVEIKENYANVRIGEAVREICLDLMEGVEVGDYVLVHAGFAIEKLDKQEAEKTLALFKELAHEVS